MSILKILMILTALLFLGGCATPGEKLYKQQMEAVKDCRPGHSCLGDVLQGKMDTKATQDAYKKGYHKGDVAATKKVASVAECVAENQADIDHGFPVTRDCSAMATTRMPTPSGAKKAVGVGVTKTNNTPYRYNAWVRWNFAAPLVPVYYPVYYNNRYYHGGWNNHNGRH